MLATQSRFWDRIADRYAAKPVDDPASYERKLTITQTYFTPRSRVLEFGCGTGTTALHHAPKVAHIDAIDLSQKMLDHAQKKQAAAGITNVHFQRSAIEEFHAPEGSYDVILGLSILHLLADAPTELRKIRKMLAPGGVFISSTVCLSEKMPWFRFVIPLGQKLRLLPTLQPLTAEKLHAMLLDAGFEIEKSWRPHGGMVDFVVAR